MTRPEPRSPAQRKADTLAQLAAPAADVWVASASVSGAGPPQAYLVPLSLGWVGELLVLALPADSRTARSITATGETRLGLGPTRDVVMIDAVLEGMYDVASAPQQIADGFAAQADWDPRDSPAGYAYLVLRPVRIQAWREANELAGRTLMRGGEWVC